MLSAPGSFILMTSFAPESRAAFTPDAESSNMIVSSALVPIAQWLLGK